MVGVYQLGSIAVAAGRVAKVPVNAGRTSSHHRIERQGGVLASCRRQSKTHRRAHEHRDWLRRRNGAPARFGDGQRDVVGARRGESVGCVLGSGGVGWAAAGVAKVPFPVRDGGGRNVLRQVVELGR